jgi:hypothetical protein
MMAKSIKQQVIEQCAKLDCGLYQYDASHFVVAAIDEKDCRVWISNSHSLTVCFDKHHPNDAFRDLLHLMDQGFHEPFDYCDDGDDCTVCTTKFGAP